MIRRTAALFAIVAFALAWVVGVWCGQSPRPRLESALLALAAGGIAGALIGVALQNIVLSRLSEQWREASAPPKETAKVARPASRAAAASATPATAPAAAPAAKPEIASPKREPAGATA